MLTIGPEMDERHPRPTGTGQMRSSPPRRGQDRKNSAATSVRLSGRQNCSGTGIGGSRQLEYPSNRPPGDDVSSATSFRHFFVRQEVVSVLLSIRTAWAWGARMLTKAGVAALALGVACAACSSGTDIELPAEDPVIAVLSREIAPATGGSVRIWAKRIDLDAIWIFRTPKGELYLRADGRIHPAEPQEFAAGDTLEVWPEGAAMRTDPITTYSPAAVGRGRR